MTGGRVLDHSAIVDIATGTTAYGQALLVTATEFGIPLAVPAAALQNAWQTMDVTGRPWLDLLPSLPTVVVEHLGETEARESGLLAAQAGQADTTAATAQAAHLALERGWTVVTLDPGPFLALDSDIRTETLPT